MYTLLLRLYIQISQESPLLFVGLLVLLLASWGLIVGVITEVAVHLFDSPNGSAR